MMTRQELAAQFGISVKTLKKYCEEKGISLPPGKLLEPAIYKKIIAQFEGK